MNIPEERRHYAEALFNEYPDQFSASVRESILEGKITLGMSPYEAKLAGGAFYYAVTADPERWPAGSDPYDVMMAQSLHPDNSVIRMTFSNSTQFPEQGLIRFVVLVEHGRAVNIEII